MGMFGRNKKEREEYRKLWEDVKNEMSIVKCNFWYEERNLPARFVEYSLFPCTESEDDEQFFSIASSIVNTALKRHYAIYHVISMQSSECSYIPKRYTGCGSKKLFTIDYYRFLKAHKFSGVQIDEAGKNLIIANNEINEGLLALLSEEYDNTYYFSAYGYSAEPQISSFEQAKKVFAESTYDIYFDYGKSPDHLSIVIDTEKINIDDIIAIIKEVCTAHGKTLKVDFN